MTLPRLLPGVAVVALDDGQAVVGPLALRGLPPSGADCLAALDGTRSLARLAAEHGVGLDWLGDALTLLSAHGLLAGPTPSGLVAVEGTGALADAVEAALRAEGADVVRGCPASGWQAATCVVLAPTRAEVGPVLPEELARLDVAHLTVLPAPGGASVGPFVVPGRSSCLHCRDLTRRDDLPRGLSTLPLREGCAVVEPSPAATAWAAGLAASHVLAFLDGAVPDSVECSWHLVGGRLGTREWPPHPECGCLGPVALPAEDASYRAAA